MHKPVRVRRRRRSRRRVVTLIQRSCSCSLRATCHRAPLAVHDTGSSSSTATPPTTPSWPGTTGIRCVIRFRRLSVVGAGDASNSESWSRRGAELNPRCRASSRAVGRRIRRIVQLVVEGRRRTARTRTTSSTALPLATWCPKIPTAPTRRARGRPRQREVRRPVLRLRPLRQQR